MFKELGQFASLMKNLPKIREEMDRLQGKLGQIISEGPRDKDALVVADLDLDQIQEVRDVWQFYRDRRPETYKEMAELLP